MTAAQATRALTVLDETRRGTGHYPLDGEKRHAIADRIVHSYLRFHEPDLYVALEEVIENAGFWAFA